MKREKDWWHELSLEELQEEFACLEQIEIDNQNILYENGHECCQKSTDALWGLVNERDELKAELSSLQARLEEAEKESDLIDLHRLEALDDRNKALRENERLSGNLRLAILRLKKLGEIGLAEALAVSQGEGAKDA